MTTDTNRILGDDAVGLRPDPGIQDLLDALDGGYWALMERFASGDYCGLCGWSIDRFADHHAPDCAIRKLLEAIRRHLGHEDWSKRSKAQSDAWMVRVKAKRAKEAT